ncbi:hypothetical protein FOZ63_021923, partial [Perkinsus olseni]
VSLEDAVLGMPSLPPLSSTVSTYSSGGAERSFIREFSSSRAATLPELFRPGKVYGYKQVARGVSKGASLIADAARHQPMKLGEELSGEWDSSSETDLWDEDTPPSSRGRPAKALNRTTSSLTSIHSSMHALDRESYRVSAKQCSLMKRLKVLDGLED